MPEYTAKLTRVKLRNYLIRTRVKWSHELTEPVWNDFMKWSRIDLAKHNSLITLEDWRDEWAEFDCAYEDWKLSNKPTDGDPNRAITAGLSFVYYPNSYDKALFVGLDENAQVARAMDLAYEDIRNIIKSDEVWDCMTAEVVED